MALFKKAPRPAVLLLAIVAVLAAALAITLIFLTTDRADALYADVTERDWFYPEVRHLTSAQLLDADPETRFFPTERLTRAEAVTLLYRLAGEPVAEGTPFSDVSPDAPCAAAAAWASETGIVTGDGGCFFPEAAVTREQLACFLYRYAAQAGLDISARGAPEGYRDASLVSPYALEAVAWAERYDLLNCRAGGALLPNGTVSRALGAVAFSRFLREVAGDDSFIPAEITNRQGRLWILMYHDVVPDGTAGTQWAVTVSQLREDLEWLTSHGYTFYLPGELAEGSRPGPKSVMLTFDDGYADNYALAFPLLREYGAKAAVAPVVSLVEAEDPMILSWEMCREMADSGLIEFGSHTFALHDMEENGLRRAPDETPEAYAQRVFPDLECSIERIEAQTGQRVYYLAYPYGVTEALAQDYVRERFALSLTTAYGPAKLSGGLYDLPRLNINAQTRAGVLGTPRKLLRLWLS